MPSQPRPKLLASICVSMFLPLLLASCRQSSQKIVTVLEYFACQDSCDKEATYIPQYQNRYYFEALGSKYQNLQSAAQDACLNESINEAQFERLVSVGKYKVLTVSDWTTPVDVTYFWGDYNTAQEVTCVGKRYTVEEY